MELDAIPIDWSAAVSVVNPENAATTELSEVPVGPPELAPSGSDRCGRWRFPELPKHVLSPHQKRY